MYWQYSHSCAQAQTEASMLSLWQPLRVQTAGGQSNQHQQQQQSNSNIDNVQLPMYPAATLRSAAPVHQCRATMIGQTAPHCATQVRSCSGTTCRTSNNCCPSTHQSATQTPTPTASQPCLHGLAATTLSGLSRPGLSGKSCAWAYSCSR